MSSYILCTDSGCDIKPALLTEWGVPYINLTFRLDGDDKEYTDDDMPTEEFYEKMRKGATAKTSAVNIENFKEFFEEFLKAGQDVLYVGFSSGLSTTYNSARVAAEELLENYPDRQIITVDTLSASAGFGMLLYLAVQKKNDGVDMAEVAKYLYELIPNMCHWFTVDDLVYLKRGGRISPTVALVGSLLNIRPVLHMDDEGHLINMFKVRGRKASVAALAKKFGELAKDSTAGPVFISHGDCLADAESLADMVKAEYGVEVQLITDVGAVIGAHSGPGTLAIFFIGKER